MRRSLLLALALVAGCSSHDNAQLSDGGALYFNIGGIPFHVASGMGRIMSGVLGLYLTDQPDACLAFIQVPVGTSTIFTLKVAAQSNGTTTATVVPPQITPSPGQAMGNILQQNNGTKIAGFDTAGGSVSWSAKDSTHYNIDSIDIAFAGTMDRLTLGGLTVPACQ